MKTTIGNVALISWEKRSDIYKKLKEKGKIKFKSKSGINDYWMTAEIYYEKDEKPDKFRPLEDQIDPTEELTYWELPVLVFIWPRWKGKEPTFPKAPKRKKK